MADAEGKTEERKELVQVTLVQITCPDCGVPFAIPEQLAQAREAEGGFLACPNGHRLVLNEEATDRMMEEFQAQAQAEAQRPKLQVVRGNPPIDRLLGDNGRPGP